MVGGALRRRVAVPGALASSRAHSDVNITSTLPPRVRRLGYRATLSARPFQSNLNSFDLMQEPMGYFDKYSKPVYFTLGNHRDITNFVFVVCFAF